MICKVFLFKEIKYLLPEYFNLNLIASLIIFSSGAYSQDDLYVLQIRNMTWMQHSDISNSLYQHITREAYEIIEKRAKEVSEISSLHDWQQRQRQIRETLIIETVPDLNQFLKRCIK